MIKEETLTDRDLQCLLALLRTPTLGPRTLRKLLQTVVYPASVFELPRQDLEKFGLKPEAISYVR
ncbi:MAG: putative Rossmann fold nucleotide-binding protein DprA/Smf involved in DNA uptake, partial [Gammaproteobacteria bacterium]